MSAYLKKPFILSDSQGHAKNGASFTLTCEAEVTADTPYTINFILPNGRFAENNSYISLSNLEHVHGNKRKSNRNITINDALDSRDQGDYICQVIDMYNNSNSEVQSITFVDKRVVQLNASNERIKTQKGKKAATFHLSYFIYPKGNIEVYNNTDDLIARNDDLVLRNKYNVIISKDDIQLSIKFPGIEDNGNFTIVAYSEGERFEKKVFLEVSGRIFFYFL